MLQPLIEGVAAGMLADDQPVAGNADGLRRHDLVGLLVLEHAVLMDAGLVREGVVADDRLVDRDRRCPVICDSKRVVG